MAGAKEASTTQPADTAAADAGGSAPAEPGGVAADLGQADAEQSGAATPGVAGLSQYGDPKGHSLDAGFDARRKGAAAAVEAGWTISRSGEKNGQNILVVHRPTGDGRGETKQIIVGEDGSLGDPGDVTV